MFCTHCGARVEDELFYCPDCGFLLETHDPSYPFSEEDLSVEERRLPGWVLLLGTIVLAACLLSSILGVGALGAYQGLQERDRLIKEAATRHYRKGLLYLSDGYYDAALAEFEAALQLVPDYQQAQVKSAQVKATLEAKLTPTAQGYDEARSFYNQGEWDEAILRLEELRALDPDYRKGEVESLLFSAYYNSGMQLVNQDRMAEAIRCFDQALELKPDDVDALGQKRLASLYLEGLSYWGSDWKRVIGKLEELYQLKPDYKDVRLRLSDAYISYGDICYREEAWCLAQPQYARAAELNPTQAAIAKRDEAVYLCARAILTPAPLPSATPLPP